jgi:CheY-like chemotaxis protein
MAPSSPQDPRGQLQLAAEVLHELKQPLLGIKAYAQMMGEQAPPATSSPVPLLLAQVERMEHIISDFTRLVSARPAPQERISLSTHVKQGLRLFQLNPESTRVALEHDIAEDLELQGNGRLIEQLVINLLNNARDAMGGRGRLKLVLARSPKGPVLSVADWGPGIPEEIRAKLFEPYVTSKQRGSGLGLSVCRRIAEEHRAQIGLASPEVLNESPPPATVFRVTFPARVDAPKVTRKLLVVDDETIIRMVFRDLMGKECEIVEAGTAEEALERLQEAHFDLIVTDKNLPGLSGLDLASEARRLNPHSKVILMTGYPSLPTAQQALELGLMDYLLKPFDEIREVRDKIRSALEAPTPSPFVPTNKRIDVYESDPEAARQIAQALQLLGMEPRVLDGAAPEDGAPAGVIVSWTFAPSAGKNAVDLGRQVSRGAPFVILAEHLTMETTLACLRGGAAACLPKLLTDVRAFSRELTRALRLSA